MEKKLYNKKSKCCGCGVCMNICPVGAITMQEDALGFLYPVVEEKQCVNCGKCERHCPIAAHDKIEINTHNCKNYAGYYKDKEKLMQCASGGAATALAEVILDQGGVVFGVTYDEHFCRAKTCKAANKSELALFRDSKYMQSDKGTIYTEVKKELEFGKKVLFTGTPCEVGAVKAYLGKEYENLYTCELICHGPTTYKVVEQYIANEEKKHKSRLVHMSVKSKEIEWKIPHLKLKFEDGQEKVQPFYHSDYGMAFSVLLRESCFECAFKGNKKVADITVGDFWGIDESATYWNKNGVSAITVHTQHGKEMLESVSEFAIYPVAYEDILKGNPHLEHSISKDRLSALLGKCFVHLGLKKTANLYRQYRKLVLTLKKMMKV